MNGLRSIWKNIHSLAVAGLTAVLFCLVAGCQSARVGMESAVEKTAPDKYAQYLNVHSPRLAKKVQIVDIRTREVGGLLQPNVTLYNRTKYPLQVQYKFAWFDKDGFEVDPEANPWQPLTLIGNETKAVQAAATNPSVRAFKLAIQ